MGKKSPDSKHEKKGATKQDSAGYAWAGHRVDLTTEETACISAMCALIKDRLAPKRLAHSISVAETAHRMAVTYGVDPYLAEVAGLLHDWDKVLTPDELWDKAKEFDLDVGPRDDRITAVLHGMTAAKDLATRLDLPSPVFQAIARHTIGATDMSELDMIVYIADMLEPLRGESMDGLRGLVGRQPLASLFAACARNSLLYLVEHGRYVHPDAVAVWNAYQPCYLS